MSLKESLVFFAAWFGRLLFFVPFKFPSENVTSEKKITGSSLSQKTFKPDDKRTKDAVGMVGLVPDLNVFVK